MTELVVAALAFAIWVYLLLLRGGFWRAAERDDDIDGAAFTPAVWPRVVVVVPARNEAEVIGTAVASLARQDYAGVFDIVVVDDHSTDGTGVVARDAARAAHAAERVQVLSAPDLAEGWTGKLWAVNCGATFAETLPAPPDYLLFSDADIAHEPGALTALVRRAQRDELVLTSLMAKLRCESFAERALIPAFIYFFRMLYPFEWVNRPDLAMAAAAGGCMLVRRDALRAAGGFAAVRRELIDDCALARLLKPHGRIWLGLTDRARSLRAFRCVGDIRRMVSRSAYAQLRYSPWILLGTVAALAVTCLAPPLLALGGSGLARWLAAAAWALMALSLQPTLRFYRVSPWWGPALPVIAGAYLGFTLDSAWQHWRGRGGMWKGRAHVPATGRR